MNSAALSDAPETKSRPVGVVLRTWAETPTLTAVALEVAPEVASVHHTPGQYVVLHREGIKVFLAIASAPGSGHTLEFLLAPAAQGKLNLQPGDRVELDPPAGRGFAIEQALDRDVFLFSVGSGISAIRPVVEVLRRTRARYGQIYLYTGARDAEEHAYKSEVATWGRDQIVVVQAISKPWVQDLFAAQQHAVHNAVAYISGLKVMVDDVRSTLEQRGMPPERIFLNW